MTFLILNFTSTLYLGWLVYYCIFNTAVLNVNSTWLLFRKIVFRFSIWNRLKCWSFTQYTNSFSKYPRFTAGVRLLFLSLQSMNQTLVLLKNENIIIECRKLQAFFKKIFLKVTLCIISYLLQNNRSCKKK